MVANMAMVKEQLPADIKVFGGHEYTVKNLKFCRTVDPQNAAYVAKEKEFIAKRNAGYFTEPTLLSE